MQTFHLKKSNWGDFYQHCDRQSEGVGAGEVDTHLSAARGTQVQYTGLLSILVETVPTFHPLVHASAVRTCAKDAVA